MAAYGNARKRHYKIRYKNLAVVMAILLLLILLIVKGCSALIHGKEDEEKPDTPTPSIDSPPESIPTEPQADPTSQTNYTFTIVTKTDAELGDGDLVLVNNNIEFLGNVTEDDLDVVREKKNKAYSVKDYTVLVRPEVMDALNNMLLDFSNATGKETIMVNAGYRTKEYQQELYEADLEKNGSDSSSLVAKPGYSEHHTGLAVDFTTYEDGKYDQSKLGTEEYTWIDDNCYRYGFVNRYPDDKTSLTLIDNEPWHFRYVGEPHATVMKNYNYCLEEYIDFLKNFTIRNGFLSVTTDDGSQYMIYYVPKNPNADTTDIYVPILDKDARSTYPYEISGNNVDGWIVTFLYKEGEGLPNPPAVAEPTVTEAPGEDGSETQPEE